MGVERVEDNAQKNNTQGKYPRLSQKTRKGVLVRVPQKGSKGPEYKETSGVTLIPVYPEDEMEELDLYPIREGYSYIQVLYDKKLNEQRLDVLEPQLTPEQSAILTLIKDALQKILNYDWERLGKMEKGLYLIQSIHGFLESRGFALDRIAREKIDYYMMRDFVGYGPIDALMNDDNVEDISCDGHNINIFIYHSKYESIRSNIVFNKKDELDSFIISLGQRCGRQITVSSPLLDGTTPEGHRVQATYSDEVTAHGSTFTIRRFKNKPFTPTDLVRNRTASAEMMAYLWMAVENGESALVCGGTGAGKTSTLNAMALFIPPGAKIVSMEDTREINLPHDNWIPSVTRTGIGERQEGGKAIGEIDMYDLVRAAMRQRPNYIIVGEVRGKEAYNMFQAMATGHTTYSTMHADSVKSMVSRLENPPLSIPRILLTALKNVIIQSPARVGKDMVRRIKEIVEIIGFEPDTNELISNTVFQWDPVTDRFEFKGHSFMFDKLIELKGITHQDMEKEFQRRAELIDYMVRIGIDDYRQIWALINHYNHDPERIMEIIRKRLGEEGDNGS